MGLRLKWTLVFLIINLVIFALELTPFFNFSLFAFTPAFAMERPWTFITSMFMHANLTHIFFNMFVLLMFGPVLESRIGSNRFILIYFLAGIVGSIGYMITAPNPLTPAVGASGAIYGIMGALAVLMPFAMVWVGGFFPMPMIVAAIFWTFSEFLGLFVPSGVARGAHLGGLFIGFLFGFYLRKQESKHTIRRKIRLRGYADWEI